MSDEKKNPNWLQAAWDARRGVTRDENGRPARIDVGDPATKDWIADTVLKDRARRQLFLDAREGARQDREQRRRRRITFGTNRTPAGD